MNRVQKDVKRKKVRETYLKFRYINAEPKRIQKEQDKVAFMKLLNMPLKKV